MLQEIGGTVPPNTDHVRWSPLPDWSGRDVASLLLVCQEQKDSLELLAVLRKRPAFSGIDVELLT